MVPRIILGWNIIPPNKNTLKMADSSAASFAMEKPWCPILKKTPADLRPLTPRRRSEWVGDGMSPPTLCHVQGATFGRLLGWFSWAELSEWNWGSEPWNCVYQTHTPFINDVFTHIYPTFGWFFMVHVVQIGFGFNFHDLRSDWFDFDIGVCQWAFVSTISTCYTPVSNLCNLRGKTAL